MPESIHDLTWFFFSTVTIMLITALCVILWYWARKICDQMDSMNKSIGKLFTTEAVTSERVTNHIGNIDVHCKGADCAFGKRANN